MLIHFPGSLRARRFEKSTDVGPIVRNGSRSPQWCGAQWRRQDTDQKCFVKSTEVVFAAVPPSGILFTVIDLSVPPVLPVRCGVPPRKHHSTVDTVSTVYLEKSSPTTNAT